LLHTRGNDKLITVRNKCSKNHTVNLKAIYNSRVVRMISSSRFFKQAAATEKQASNSTGISHLTHLNLSLHPTPQTKI